MSLYLWILLFSLVGGVFSLVGGVFLLLNEKWVKKNTLVIVSWAAGVLLSVSFLDLFPKAIEMAIDFNIEPHLLFQWAFIAIVGFFFLERSFVWFHHHHEPDIVPPTSILILIGDSLHNFIDGVVITTSFMISIPVGIVTSIAIAAHEIPQEIADFGILLKTGMKKTRVFFLNFLSALMTVVGAFSALLFSNWIETKEPQLLAFTAGMFTYIACSDLIPELHHSKSKYIARKQFISFIAGVVVTYLIVQIAHGWE